MVGEKYSLDEPCGTVGGVGVVPLLGDLLVHPEIASPSTIPNKICAAGMRRCGRARSGIEVSVFTLAAFIPCSIKSSNLEGQLQTELHDARIVCIDRVQKRVARHACLRARVVARGHVPVAVDRVVACVARMRGVIDAELSVIKNIEELSPELKASLAGQGKVLKQRHIEVGAGWIVQRVTSGVAECKPARCDERRRIEQQWADVRACPRSA